MLTLSRSRLIERKLTSQGTGRSSGLRLTDGSRIGVIGGGPACTFFTYFLLEMSDRIGLKLNVDIYEPRDFFTPGPKGCNHCGGIISESLVQNLASEGINLPPEVIQRGIDSYVMHTDVGTIKIETPLHEKRIGAVHRGSGPKGHTVSKWSSFDGFLQQMAKEKGATIIPRKVHDIARRNGQFEITGEDYPPAAYDLIAVAVGVNTDVLDLFGKLDIGYSPPGTTKTFIREYYFGEEQVARYIGNSMHVFVLNIPRLEFAALILKGDYVTLCMLGEDIDSKVIKSFFQSPKVQQCFPPGITDDHNACQCLPHINIKGVARPYADRIVFIGDCGVNRLNKDGIGVAYRAAKAAATTVIFEGVSARDFNRHYGRICRNISMDNTYGKLVFLINGTLQKFRFARKAIFSMVSTEQKNGDARKDMSVVMWDMFTGSAPYTEIFFRTLHPFF